jgi:hypothetical protein
MLHVKVRRRGRIVASLVASLGLAAAASAVTSEPAVSVPPEGDCPTAFAVADLVRDQPVEGLTVTQGTTPTEFGGTVIGVLHDGIAPGLDMIMMRLSSAEIDRVGGIWQGMSGSPVYTTGGELIGAVAYGLSWGPSPVAGITPYEEMNKYLAPAAPSPARQIEVSDAEASRIAAESDVTQGQASSGFSRLRIPRTFSGVSGWRLERTATLAPPHGKARPYIVKNAGTVSGAGGAAADASTLVAGGNLGATFAYGDITAGGVGTVTSVCEGRLVGFGHPMMFSGRTTLSLHPADAVYVQEDSLGAPFKLANMGAPVGTIDQDRTAGISGVFGEGLAPDTMDVTSNLSYPGAAPRSGTTHVSVPAANAEMTFYEQLANHDAVLESFAGGTELQRWTITGTEGGTPFTITHRDRFTSTSDIAFESPWDAADAVWALGRMPGVVVETVAIDGDIVDDTSTWRVTRLEQSRGGRWVTVDRRHPALGRAGGTLRVRARLESGSETRTVPLALAIPGRAGRTSGALFVGGGASDWFNAGKADSVTELKKGLSQTARNDALAAQLFLEGRHAVFEGNVVSDPTDKVVTGQRLAGLVVR